MGMFDSIIVNEGIKCGKQIIKEFQTKSLECCLANYMIKKGYFYREITNYREPREEEKHYWDKEKKHYTPVAVIEHIGWKKDNYTGGLNIYTSACPINAKTKKAVKEGDEWPSEGIQHTKWIDVTYLIDKGRIIKEKISIRRM